MTPFVDDQLSHYRWGLFLGLSCLVRFTHGFPPPPSSVPSCLSPRGGRTAIPLGSWCRRAAPRYFSSVRPRPATADGWLRPGREISSWEVRRVPGHERSKTEGDTFPAPGLTLLLHETDWLHKRTATRTLCAP